MLILAFFFFFVVDEQREGPVLPVPIWFMKSTSFIQEKWWEKNYILIRHAFMNSIRMVMILGGEKT